MTGERASEGETAAEWREYFAFDEPYEKQADAIESAIQVGRGKGYLAMEGPCGTGKTMAALTAAATLLRRTTQYENVVVVTPVKQQRQQFVEDLRAMNERLEEPLAGISLTGKRDLCPYGREDVFPEDASVHDRCEDLREDTARLVEAEGAGGSEAVAEARIGGEADEDQWWDPARGSDLVREARQDADTYRTFSDALETAGAESPYPRQQPTAPEAMADSGDPPLFCPFEADWYARNKGSPVGFDAGENYVVTPEDYLPRSVERGTCPHRVMGVLLEAADVVVGNYNHLFDPNSRPLLEDILDSRTFVIVDEAHRLEERVRDLLSDRVGRDTLKRARNDCGQLLARARQSNDHEQQVRNHLASHDVPLEAIDSAREFYDDVVEWLDDRVERHLDEEVGREWRADASVLPERTMEVPLRDPETVEPDGLTEWAQDADYDGGLWRSLGKIGTAVETTIDDLGLTRTPVVAATGAIMRRWWERDHARYLREIELEDAPKDERAADAPYETAYNAGLVLYNCMPGEALERIFSDLGGGVLMSATLAPLDVFSEVVGLEKLQEEVGDQDGKPVVSRSYGLSFPRENRASWVVDATPFTARNRGDPAEMRPLGDGWNPVRDEYAHALRSLARNHGNVLIAMPNYREAEWAGAYLAETVDKAVLVDESSSNEATEQRKREFFRGAGKVLVTSARGTLTEGVDYDGDKLSAAAVVGIPLVNVGSPRVRAVRRAYADAFGEDVAFEYALTVPAVRRARQALGRVIRGTDEVGVRALVGRRYTPNARHSVWEYLPEYLRDEVVQMTPEFLDDQQQSFWNGRNGG
ncbi:ATP-dependent DNA helicase [Haloarculaceae archaeon H-GB11]|nr:ATP-dependent DNA helicase [Haloarculaceae archaeon H-GB11]